MTWIAKIYDENGNLPHVGGNTCAYCKHQPICQIHKVVGIVGALLSRIDTFCDGKWANGQADLRCAGFESKKR